MAWVHQILPDRLVERRYVQAGARFGDAVSFLYLGECDGFEQLLDKWAVWEQEYARRSYRTVSLDRFVAYGGYNVPLDDALGIRREVDEAPVYHAALYREHFLGQVVPAIDMGALLEDGEPQQRMFVMPSTEALLSEEE